VTLDLLTVEEARELLCRLGAQRVGEAAGLRR
jgi:hypothetical protein